MVIIRSEEIVSSEVDNANVVSETDDSMQSELRSQQSINEEDKILDNVGQLPTSCSENDTEILVTPEEAKDITDSVESHSLVPGETWYLIAKKWWDQFICSTTSNDNDKFPGPIDNKCLLSVGTETLKSNLVEHLDYVLVPQEAYSRLINIFGVKRSEYELPRKVIESGLFKKQSRVEVYPINLRICLSTKKTDIKNVILSRAQTLGDLLKLVCKELDVNEWDEKLKLYIYHDEGDTYEGVDLEQKGKGAVLEDLVYPNQLIIVDKLDAQSNGRVPQFKINKTDGRNADSSPCVSSGHQSGQRPHLFGASATSNYSGASSSYSSSHLHRSTSEQNSRGLCGLQNLGNTCFMNSALQCLSNVPQLTEYFLSDAYQNNINESNPLGMRGQLARAYGELIHLMWSGNNRAVIPRRLKMIIGQFAPRFSGYAQQDSQELLAFLLDGLHEDLNRVREKPYIEEKEANGRQDKEMAEEAWQDYKKRNDSVIVDLFHGQLKSTLVCPDCAKISIKFDPFCFLSLPLPQKEKMTTYKVLFVPLNAQTKWVKYKVTVPKAGPYENVYKEIAGLVELPTSWIVLGEHIPYDNSLKLINPKDRPFGYTAHADNKLMAFEMAEDLTADEDYVLVIASQCRREPTRGVHYGSNKIGVPVVFMLKPNELYAQKIVQVFAQVIRSVMTCYEGDRWSMDEVDNEERDDEDSGVENDANGNPWSGQSMLTLACPGHNPSALLTTTSATHLFGPKTRPVLRVIIAWHPTAEKCFFNHEWKANIELDKSMQVDDVTSVKKMITIGDCLDLFTKEEKLGEHDSWYCPDCKQLRRATKRLDLWQLPEILILHLKRFQYSRWSRDKIETVVHLPIHGLDLRENVLNEDHGNASYDLIGISNHMGGLGGGHYTAVALNNGRWVNFNDSSVSTIGAHLSDSLINREAYVLVYRRCHAQKMCPRVEPNIEMECDDE